MAERSAPELAGPTDPRLEATGSHRRRMGGLAAAWTVLGTDRLLQIGLLLVLGLGTWRVVEPFLPAILFSMAVASCGWPAYKGLRRLMSGHEPPAALLACALVLIGVLSPALLLILGLADGAQGLLAYAKAGSTSTLPPVPEGVRMLPVAGTALAQAWDNVRHDPKTFQSLLTYVAGPTRDVALMSGRALANAAVQATLSALLLYFFFRNGERLANALHDASERLCGERARELIGIARSSVAGVMFGEIGAGMAQGAVATIGFLIADVPNPFLLGAATFILSIVPVGPPLIWFGAGIWLLHEGREAWALFMLCYGMFVISTIDNVIKPVLISRSSRLPFVFALVGVFGGMLGFGVVGVFLGPTLLALAADLAAHWLRPKEPSTAQTAALH